MRNFFSRLFNIKKSEDNKVYSPELSGLFNFLTKEITVPRRAQNILVLARQAHKKNSEELLSVYLLVESHLCNLDPEQKHTRPSLRNTIRLKFPQLADDLFFSILFLSDEEKKVKLGAHFLKSCLELCFKRFGRTKEGLLDKKLNVFRNLFAKPSSDLSFDQIHLETQQLYEAISESYGDTLTGKIFGQAFHETAKCFRELEVFPHIVSLLPNEIIGREQLNVLTQTQFEQIFLEKLAEVEKLNVALQKQVSEREKAEDLVRKNEAMLSSIISSALDAIITIDKTGTIITWNAAANETFGYSEVEVLGRRLQEIVIPTKYSKYQGEDFGDYLLDNSLRLLNKRLELVLVRKDTVEIPAELTITTVTHNNQVFFNCFLRDISDRKKREHEILLMKEKAEQAVIAKSQFLSVMSHEIRTPLNAVIGFSHLLLENNPRPDQVEYLNILKFSGENLLNLVNDILDFSKLDSGKALLDDSSFSLKSLIENLHKSFYPKAIEKKINLYSYCDPLLPDLVKGDLVRLTQVLNNLLSNAVKFTDKGSVSFTVTINGETGKYYKTDFIIKDTGIGIPADKQETIFELFTQADSSTGRKYGGTGLGLNIAQKIISLMGGKLQVKSEPGMGSEFYFTVNLAKSEPVMTNQAEKDSMNHETIMLHNIKILLAEDHKANSLLAKQFISKWGAEVYIAENGQEALALLSEQQFDIILMDLQMPIMDGFECATMIRQNYPNLPILALTASRSQDIEERAYAVGMNDIVGKPFKPKELKAKIIQYVHGKLN